MNENELHERYIRLAFQYESAIDALLTKGLVDIEAADAAKERFYDTLNEEKLRTTQKIRDYHETISLYMRMLAYDGMVSLTELARQYSDESPGYVIQSWMRSRNTLEFLRQWENDMNEGFDDRACEELIFCRNEFHDFRDFVFSAYIVPGIQLCTLFIYHNRAYFIDDILDLQVHNFTP